MANTTTFSLRIDQNLKEQSEALYGELGLNLTAAINVFLRQSLRTGGFPFPVCLEQPNKTTIAALQEAKQIVNDPNYKYYTDVESALRDLKA